MVGRFLQAFSFVQVQVWVRQRDGTRTAVSPTAR